MIKEVYKKNKGWDKKHGKMAVLICDYCGKEFKRAYGCINRKDETRRYSKNYCSVKCKTMATRKKIQKFCNYCGIEIYITPFNLKSHKNHFCSRECFLKWNYGSNAGNYKGGKITIKCAFCNKKINVDRYRQKMYKNKFCNKECFYDWTKENMPKGENSYNWTGGKSKYPSGYIRINNTGIYEHRFIMEKYLGRKLYSWEEVHHINGIKDDNRIENLKLLPGNEHNKKVQKVYQEIQKLKEENQRLLKLVNQY